MKIDGKVAVVSGGGSGIGRAAVLALTARGAKVIVADVDATGGEETVDMALGKGGSAVFQHCDVTRTEDLVGAFGYAVQQLGRLDIAFNNAGIGDEDLFADDPGAWKRLIEVDLTAVIDATRIAVREMKRSGNGGVIINTASLIGLEPMSIAPVYSAAKAGVVSFTRALAYLHEDANVRVNAICPEIVATPMTRSGVDEQIDEMIRRGEILMPEEIAAALVELIEDDSRFGAVMKVTIQGGREYATF